MKRKLFSLITLIMIGGLLMGCGSSETSKPTNNINKTNDTKPTTSTSTTDTSIAKGQLKDGQEEVEIEKLGDSILEQAYNLRGYSDSSYGALSTALYQKQLIKTQKNILEQEKQQTDLLKKIEINTRK